MSSGGRSVSFAYPVEHGFSEHSFSKLAPRSHLSVITTPVAKGSVRIAIRRPDATLAELRVELLTDLQTQRSRTSQSPFKMVYDWEGKEGEIYQLYIIQKKSLDEIVEFMKEKYNFTPRYVGFRYFPMGDK